MLAPECAVNLPRNLQNKVKLGGQIHLKQQFNVF